MPRIRVLLDIRNDPVVFLLIADNMVMKGTLPPEGLIRIGFLAEYASSILDTGRDKI